MQKELTVEKKVRNIRILRWRNNENVTTVQPIFKNLSTTDKSGHWTAMHASAN